MTSAQTEKYNTAYKSFALFESLLAALVQIRNICSKLLIYTHSTLILSFLVSTLIASVS